MAVNQHAAREPLRSLRNKCIALLREREAERASGQSRCTRLRPLRLYKSNCRQVGRALDGAERPKTPRGNAPRPHLGSGLATSAFLAFIGVGSGGVGATSRSPQGFEHQG